MTASLDQIILPYLEQGYFTRAYIEAGFLHEDSARLAKSYGKSGEYFDLASITKALSTGVLIHQWVDEGTGNYDGALGEWLLDIPPRLQDLSIRNLLAHQSSLPPWRSFWIDRLPDQVCRNRTDRSQLVKEVLHRMVWRPVEGEAYSDIGYIVLGMLLEEQTGESLDHQFSQYCRTHLGRDDLKLGFNTQIRNLNPISTGFCHIRNRQLLGEVHDENCAALGEIAGHCGLFASGEALGCFLRLLYQSSIGQRFFTENVNSYSQNGKLLGFRPGDDPSSFPFGRGQGIGHLGFTGTAFWIEPQSRRYAILLTNRVISGRVSAPIKIIRRDVFSKLYEFLEP